MLLVDINLAAAEKTLALVKERFPNVKAAAIKADVGKEEDVKGAVDKAVELFGRLDIMVRACPSESSYTHLFLLLYSHNEDIILISCSHLAVQ